MLRRTALALSLVAVGPMALAAHADPVESARYAATTLHVDLGDGAVLGVDLLLTDVNGAARLRVTTQRCDGDGCDTPRSWAGAVTAGHVDGSAAVARLRTVLAGVPVEIRWAPDSQPGVVLQGLDAEGGPDGDSAAVAHGDPASVRVLVDDRPCATTGAVGDQLRVSDSDTQGAAPLSRLRLPAAPSC